MKNLLWLFLLPVLFLNSCNFFNSIKPSKELSEYSVDISGASIIDASGIYNITVIKGEEESIAVTCNENLKEFLNIYQKGSTIHLEMDNLSTSSGVVLEVIITAIDLSRINLSGVSEVKMNEIGFDNLALHLSGASRVKASDYTGNKLSIEASGASSVKLTGTVNTITADCSGASNVKGKNLDVTDVANFEGSGACNFTIACSNIVNANLSGASSLVVYGNPKKLTKEVSGASSVKIK